ncbi:unnamed protein product [Bursaphelenchus xylophilus]|uniref:(pine wood nematode) hypothetical protein n=1 Tax=Bursaphelenchus xylophilus TaxID=6326 RepID=A0A1I7SUL1_BURXY|nr:unnamed protein product [Bursaphelenchus xylophilus]CAG9118609.1 unnamed protein product [Bursaphelenchus xylophilus]
MEQSVDARLLPNHSSNLPEPNGNGNMRGSCPDLSDDQLRMWDDILYKAIQNEREALQNKEEHLNKFRRKTFDPSITQRARSNTPMNTSIYEICAPVDVEGNENNDNVLTGGEDDCDENGNLSNPTTSLDEAFDLRSNSSSTKENQVNPPARNSEDLAKRLRKELEDLQFRNTCEWQTSNGEVMKINTNPLFDVGAEFPQNRRKSVDFSARRTSTHFDADNFNPTHITNYDAHKHPFGTTSLYMPNGEKPSKCSFEEDYFEGMNIRVNPFEESDDIALEEADCPPATRFQQLQWAIQRQKDKYNDQLQMPERVCCNLM